jgi:hypothetical protein
MKKRTRLRKKTWLRKTFVMLGYRGDHLDPAAITAKLGVEPNDPADALAKSDIVVSKGREHAYWTGVWRVRTDSLKSNEIDDHLRALLKILDRHRRAALRIRNTPGYRSWLWIH